MARAAILLFYLHLAEPRWSLWDAPVRIRTPGWPPTSESERARHPGEAPPSRQASLAYAGSNVRPVGGRGYENDPRRAREQPTHHRDTRGLRLSWRRNRGLLQASHSSALHASASRSPLARAALDPDEHQTLARIPGKAGLSGRTRSGP